MEGDKIIKALKNCSDSRPVDLNKTYSAIKRFLSLSLTSSTCGNAAKCELFCLKCLKACVDVLANSSITPSGYIAVVDILTDALGKCFGSNNKIPQLSCEKVLLHIVKEYCVKKCYNEQLKITQLLQSLLRKGCSNQVTSLHKNVTELLWRTSSQLENNILCLQFRLAAILSMIDAKCSEHSVMENIIKCSSWYQMTSSGSCDLLTFYNELDQYLPQSTELCDMSLFLCHYCKICYDNCDENFAEKCLKRLSRLSIDQSSELEAIVVMIRMCHLIDIQLTNNGVVEEDKLIVNINKVVNKLKDVRAIKPAMIFVIEWFNKLITNCSLHTNALLTAISRLHEQLYLPYVCDQKKISVYKMLLNLLFTQIKLVVEADEQLDNKTSQQSTELALSLIKKAEECCNKLGSANEHGCLGNVTFNIGLALSRGHRYVEACALLSVACDNLKVSCDHQTVLTHKVQLSSKYHLLYKCQRKAGYHDDALDTLVIEANCIPSKHLADDGILSYLLTCWVETYHSISSNYRSIVDVLQPHPPDHLITVILEAELIECRNHGSVEAWHVLIIRLTKWYKEQGRDLLQARLLVEQAEWCLYHGSNPVTHCNEALILLDSCHSNTEEWHYCRGLANFWLGVCHYALLTKSCGAGSCDSIIDAILNGLTEWEAITMETRGIDYHHSYRLLQTILHLSSLLLEFSIQLRVVNLIMCLTAGNHGDDWMEKAHIYCQYQYCDVLIGINVSAPLPSWQHDCPMLCCSCDHINILLICCKHHMMLGEISKAVKILEYVIEQHHKDYFSLAETKMLYSRLLQCRNPHNLLSSQSLLDHVRHTSHTSLTSYKATSLELLLEALQLLRMLCKDVQLTPGDDEVHMWMLLGKLLECLHHVITTLHWHGNCREAIYYYKEADSVCAKFNLYYWRVRFMNLMSKLEIMRGQSPSNVVTSMHAILRHSFDGNSLVCNHGSKQCWKDSTNPYFFNLMCHMIFCHASFCDDDDIIPLVNLANQIAIFAAVACSKELKSIMGSKAQTDFVHFFKWVGLTGYTVHCRHLINTGHLSSAVSLPIPTMPTTCCNPDDAILWAELSLIRGVALAEASLDSQTFLKACWCYHSNIKLHKAFVTSRKRSRDVLADSSPELPQLPIDVVSQQQTEEEPYDDIMFRSDQSSGYLGNLESKSTAKGKCKSGRGKKLNKKSSKQKVKNQPHPHPSPAGICNNELWPAIEMFLLCYQLCHPVCYSMLLRDVCLWIATCIGHHDDPLTAYFLYRSHGNVLHHKMVELCRKKYQLNGVCNYKSFDTMLGHVKPSTDEQPHPHSIIQHALLWGGGMLPPTLDDFDWLLSEVSATGHSLVSLSISPYCSPSHLLLCRVQHNSQPLLHCVTSGANNPLDQFNQIISQGRVAASSTEKSKFWIRRRQLNQDLEDLLTTTERTWLGVWKILLLGDHLNDTALQDASEELLELINSANGNCCSNGRGWLKLLINSIEHLSNIEVDELLTTVTMGTVSLTHMRKIHQTAKQIHSIIMDSETERKPITILLGRLLHQFPWEQLPMLQIQPITRMPSLSVVVAHYIMLGKCGEVTVDTTNCYYMLNPSGNLGNTEKTFSKWFSSEPGWTGIVGKVTGENHVINVTKHQMFIYCGHGAGQEYLHGDNIQKLHNIATSFLIGCSSGQLVELGSLDPNGTVLSYLMAASPAVIANLWDVTDADTDRFCHALLKSWLHEGGASLVSMVAPARQHCKLPYLVGGAAVMYGFPFILNNKAHSL